MHFGEGILTADGALDRPKLGAIIFNDESQRRVVNGIVHPAVWRAMFWAVVRCWAKGNRVCVLDVPLLVEGGMWKWVGKTVVVYWYVVRLWSVRRCGVSLGDVVRRSCSCSD